ncbi:MAG: hypothetical protein P8181_09340, partial [bacterium]
VWDGTDPGGTPAPEDTFLVLLRAASVGGADADTAYSRYFFLDVTSPTVVITDLSPERFAPDSSNPPQEDTLFVEYDIHDPPPSDEVAAEVVIFDQTPKEVATLRTGYVGSNGSYTDSWDGSGTTKDGEHTVRVYARDEAGNEAEASRRFDVDLNGPTIAITNLESGLVLTELPDSVYGWAWHRHGVYDSVWSRFSTPANVDEPYVLLETTWFRSDTLFFSAPLKSVVEQQQVKYTFNFRAKDLLGVRHVKNLDVTWDQTPPPPPELEQPPKIVHSRNFVLSGRIPASVGFEDVMRIYRNGVLADSVFPAVPDQWPHPMTLTPGLNRIYGVMVDKAGNIGEPSNTIEVTWDRSVGVFIRQPFRPDDAIDITSREEVTSVTIRIYDMSGNLVRVVRHGGSGTNISVPWNGLNGDGTDVKKGPLVAVVRLTFLHGDDETHRKIFLFEP